MDKESKNVVNITESDPEYPVYELDNGCFAVKDGYSVVEKFMDAEERKRLYDADPDRVIHDVTIDDIPSLVGFVNTYKTETTRLFYNNNFAVAVFNYHSAPEDPQRCDSRASLPFRLTDVFAEFKEIVDGAKLSQRDFVRFLKKSERFFLAQNDNFTAADILMIAQSLTLSKQIDGVERNTKRSFTMNLEIKANKTEIEIPEKLTFRMRPFFCSDRTADFTVELFIEGGDNGFAVELMPYDLAESLENCVNEIISDIAKGISDVPAYRVCSIPSYHKQTLFQADSGLIKASR